MTFKQNLHQVEEAGSTNEVLMRASLEEFPFGSSLLALTQTAGRGRAGREWESVGGGLYISTILLPTEFEGLCLLGALAVLKVVQSRGVSAQLRWPNDVYVGQRKLAGVLPMSKFRGSELERAVLGVGLNVSQAESSFSPPLRPTSTTLARETGQEIALLDIAQDYLEQLETLYHLLEDQGVAALAQLAEAKLQGRGVAPGPVILKQGQVSRRCPTISGLGPRGELVFEDGQTLSALGPDERLVVCQ